MEKTDAEVAYILEQDMAPLDLHISTCEQEVLVALFEYEFIIELFTYP